MSVQALLADIRKHLPLRVYAKGPVLEMFREMGRRVDKNTALQLIDAYREPESGELICTLTADGNDRATASLGHLRVDISHPLFNGIRNYRREMEQQVAQPQRNVNSAAFRVGDLYRKK
jgi:hypothetical protein